MMCSKSEPTIIFLLKENKTLFSLIRAPFSICDYNDFFFFLLSSSHSLMKTLNKTGLCRGPQVPGIFQVVWLLFIMTFFFPLPILQLFSIHVTVLPCKSIWINFASKMLYGSEYIICLSHREKKYTVIIQHSCWLFPLKAAGGERMLKTPLSFEVFWALCYSLPYSLSLFSPLCHSVLVLMQKMMVETVQPDISLFWSLGLLSFWSYIPPLFPPYDLTSLFLTPQRINVNLYLLNGLLSVFHLSPSI